MCLGRQDQCKNLKMLHAGESPAFRTSGHYKVNLLFCQHLKYSFCRKTEKKCITMQCNAIRFTQCSTMLHWGSGSLMGLTFLSVPLSVNFLQFSSHSSKTCILSWVHLSVPTRLNFIIMPHDSFKKINNTADDGISLLKKKKANGWISHHSDRYQSLIIDRRLLLSSHIFLLLFYY